MKLVHSLVMKISIRLARDVFDSLSHVEALFITPLSHVPALFMTSLTQSAGHDMAALTVVFSRLSNVDF